MPGVPGVPRFWQISLPYLNQGGQIIPTRFSDLPTALLVVVTVESLLQAAAAVARNIVLSRLLSKVSELEPVRVHT